MANRKQKNSTVGILRSDIARIGQYNRSQINSLLDLANEDDAQVQAEQLTILFDSTTVKWGNYTTMPAPELINGDLAAIYKQRVEHIASLVCRTCVARTKDVPVLESLVFEYDSELFSSKAGAYIINVSKREYRGSSIADESSARRVQERIPSGYRSNYVRSRP